MENKNIMYGIIVLAVGFLLGWVIFADRQYSSGVPSGMHMMNNGEMMENGGMLGMNDAMGSMMMNLEGKTGDNFDRAFLSEMIMHHQGAIVMSKAVLENSKRPELIKLANDIISAQTAEIKMMQDWQEKWFNK